MSTVRQAIILSVALLFAVALVWQLALAAADELRRTSRRCTAISFVLFMLMCGVTVHVCATKPQTNDTDGVAAPTYGMLSFLMAPEIGGMTDEYDAFSSTNVYFFQGSNRMENLQTMSYLDGWVESGYGRSRLAGQVIHWVR